MHMMSEQGRDLAVRLQESEAAAERAEKTAEEMAATLAKKTAEVDSLTMALQRAILEQKGVAESQMDKKGQKSRKSR
jgi:hypothetical protein